MIHSFFIFIPVIFKGKKWPLSIPPSILSQTFAKPYSYNSASCPSIRTFSQ
ncbi:unnamed protein product [Meloidogyne enterolobii]|uniref:Uncharacterized protein n=1 Tax=Meloidogyne enterolobii TaxID=390850 RepID=A0ACB0Y408_MELEN